MDFWFLSFCPVATPYKGEAVFLLMQPSLGIKKGKKIKQALAHFDSSKLIQVSMDGPAVNLKFLRDLITESKADHPDASDLIDIGVLLIAFDSWCVHDRS